VLQPVKLCIMNSVQQVLKGNKMKRKGQGKKECVVMKFDDYTNTWKEWSVPVTINQAVKIVLAKNPKYFRIDSIQK
jgi:hypothetical protein